jgi:Peptidase family M23/LysM domain
MSSGSPVCPEDSAPCRTSQETAAVSEAQEDDFQKGLNSLFENEQFDIDTSTWNNTKINAGHFDSETWPDTARIPLVDSTQRRYFVHPFKNCITSNFGQRHALWHYGVDIRLSKGDTVRAALDGIVRVLQFDRHGYGKVVVIRHHNGLETLYGHLSRELVSVNQAVHAGQVVGLGGSTGHSTGSHLHFEMRFFGEPFDPNHIIDFDKYELKCDTLVLTKADFAYLVDQRKATWHVVRRGETLGHIARLYHTTVNKICALNRISGRTIMSVGRKLLVRAAPPPADSKLTLTHGQPARGLSETDD